MKRSEHLQPLSHDHYEGLTVAARIRKGLQNESPPSEIAAYVANFWDDHLSTHFELEEELLLPLMSEMEAGDLADRMLDEHRKIEGLVISAREAVNDVGSALEELSEMMKAHIRFEERTLFPAIEEQAAPEALHEAGRRLEDAHRSADLSWNPVFWE